MNERQVVEAALQTWWSSRKLGSEFDWTSKWVVEFGMLAEWTNYRSDRALTTLMLQLGIVELCGCPRCFTRMDTPKMPEWWRS